MRKAFLILAVLTGTLIGCRKPVYFHHETIAGQEWNAKDEVPFEVNIPEAGTYSLSFLIRFTEEYQWSNLWLRASVEKGKGERLFSERFNIPLSDNGGRPLLGMTGAFADRNFPSPIIEQRPLPIGFKEAGTYIIKIKQEMRDNMLRGIASVGLKLERLD